MQSYNLASLLRPKKLTGYVGQQHMLPAIKSMLDNQSVPATILISGPTGCGKTTLAQLFARYINCETGNSCGKCLSCRQMNSGSHPDYMQLDMGSNGRIEDVRKIVDMVSYAPTFNKRILVLDECHALTKASGNALLLTVETPPPDTIFIFCTTEPEKVLAPLVGRCTQFNVRLIDSEVIANRLLRFLSRGLGGIEQSRLKEVTPLIEDIAERSGGLMRNAIASLQAVYEGIMSDVPVTSLMSNVSSCSGDVAIDDAAVAAVLAFCKMDLIEVIKAIREQQDFYKLAEAMRWVLHGAIGQVAGANKWVSPPCKKFLALVKKNRLKLNPVALIYMQHAINDVQIKMQTVSINHGVLLETTITHMMVQIYEGKLTVNLE